MERQVDGRPGREMELDIYICEESSRDLQVQTDQRSQSERSQRLVQNGCCWFVARKHFVRHKILVAWSKLGTHLLFSLEVSAGRQEM